jgi:hypothetical protein
MAFQLNIANYAKLNAEINAFYSNGEFFGVQMTVFTDNAAVNVAVDENGPIQDRKITSVSMVDPLTNTDGGVTTGSITVNFKDGSFILSTDTIDSYWYTLSGIPFRRRTFGSA